MPRTTTSRATFCSPGGAAALALALVLVSCGKRGDPLPPLRPVPEPAQELQVRQVGGRIQLEWKAPSRNHDGTTEKFDLLEARVLRRVIDIASLVEEQTKLPEPPSAAASAAPTEAAAEPAAEADLEEAGAPQQAEPPPAEEEASAEETPAEGTVPAQGGSPSPPPSPPAPQRPTLVVPPFAEAAEVTATLPSLQAGEALSFEQEIDPTWLGKRVEYAVVQVNRKKRASPLSPIVQIEPVVELAPPSGLRAVARDGFVSIEWSPPEPPEATKGRVGFAVFRRPAAEASYPKAPLVPETRFEPVFEDRTAVFGVESCYVVSAVLEPARPEPVEEAPEPSETPSPEGQAPGELPEPPPQADETPPQPGDVPSGETPAAAQEDPIPPGVPIVPPLANPVRIESRPSEEVCLTPEDVFPPPAPTGLVGVAAGEEVLLTWRFVEAADLAGYRVYRREESSLEFELLAEVESTSYTDETAASGERYLYAVTAIDRAPAPNESPRSEIIAVTRRE